MSCVLVDARDLPRLRRAVVGLLRPRQRRLHFHDESAGRRRALLEAFASLRFKPIAIVTKRTPGADEEAAREICLRYLVSDLQTRSVARLVLESRHDDRRGARTIARARRPAPPLVFEHRLPIDEPALWIADGVAWAVGLGGTHLTALGPEIHVVELRQ